jgi:hypothetical protein
MAAVRALTRAELRSRWPALLGLVLLVALASGVILTAVVGARRTSSAAERFSAWSNAADATLQSPSDEEGAALYEKARELPYVKDAALRYIVNAFPAGADDSTPDFSMFTDPKGRYAVEIDRPRVLRGRMPDPNSPDEIAVDELTAELLGRDVGDHLHLATWTPDDLVALFDGTTFPGFNGPRLDLIVVGVTRAPYALEGQTGRATLTSTVGPRFLEAHPGVAAWPPVIVATVEDPRRDLPRLANDMGSVGGNEREADLETADEAYADSTERAVGALTTGLWVFALVAGLAAAVTVGQAVSRQVASASAPEWPGSAGRDRTRRQGRSVGPGPRRGRRHRPRRGLGGAVGVEGPGPRAAQRGVDPTTVDRRDPTGPLGSAGARRHRCSSRLRGIRRVVRRGALGPRGLDRRGRRRGRSRGRCHERRPADPRPCSLRLGLVVRAGRVLGRGPD